VHRLLTLLYGGAAPIVNALLNNNNNNKRQFVRRRNMSVDITRAPYRSCMLNAWLPLQLIGRYG